jgi:putative sigma-54 modulation protein
MNLNLKGHHVEITPAIREYVTSKFARINRHFDQVLDVSVIMAVEKLKHRIEANVHVPKKDIFAECDDQEDMYAAIDLLVDKLDRQIVKYKELYYKDRHNGALKHQEVSE